MLALQRAVEKNRDDLDIAGGMVRAESAKTARNRVPIRLCRHHDGV